MTTFLEQVSDGLADAVAAAGKSIVRVEGRRRLAGSGVAWSADGLIVTANHVVEMKEGITVGLPDGSTAAAVVVGRDPTTDLVVLRVNTSLQAAAWVDPASLRVGHLVLAIGRPGDQLQSTLGVISALGAAWQTGAGGAIDAYLQTDVVMYPGFSGGPLVSVTGELIGLNSSSLARGVSVTIPAPTLRRVAAMLVEHGRVRRGYLGVGVQTARLPAGVADELGQETGVLIISVEPGSSAEAAGLVLGDTIVALDARAVRRVDDLQAHLAGDRVGQPVAVRIVRAGRVQDAVVTLAERM